MTCVDPAAEIAECRRTEKVLLDLNASLELRVGELTADVRNADQESQAEACRRRQADELLGLILANVDDGLIVANAKGVVTLINDAAARLIGREATEIMHSPVSVLHIQDAASRARIDLMAAMDALEPKEIHGNCLLLSVAGLAVPIELRGLALRAVATMHGMLYILRNCTERRHAADVEQRIAALVESAEDAIITKSLDGVVLSWNPAAERLLGYRPHEIIGQPIARLLPDDRLHEESQILLRMRRGESVAHFETVRRRKDGSQVDVSLTISPIRDGAGLIVGASKIMRDITERKLYIEQLRDLNEELEARVLSRTAALRERDVMIQEIHHRVKNNLQVICSLISMQVRSINEPSLRVALQQCQARVQTMAQIHEMLYQSKDYARVALRDYAKALAARVLSSSGASSAVTIEYRMAEVSLPLDQAIPCGLILNELLCNALKHAFPSGVGAVVVGLHRSEEGQACLTVSDDGVGLPQNFSVSQTDSLGMVLVTALVNQLNGALEISSQPGATFCITFPCEDSA